jgi:hypothetical protein
MFLFIFASNSLFVNGLFGLFQAAVIEFGIGFVSAFSRNRRPSRIWAADVIGSFIGVVIGVILIRENTQQSHHVWNQLVLYILPISAVIGSVISSVPFIRKAIDQILNILD